MLPWLLNCGVLLISVWWDWVEGKAIILAIYSITVIPWHYPLVAVDHKGIAGYQHMKTLLYALNLTFQVTF